MELNTNDIALIKHSFHNVHLSKSNIAERFYANLFEMAPLVKPMFKVDQEVLEIHFQQLLSELVEHVDDLNSVRSLLLELGVRHADYGAQEAHYPVVKSALLLSIESELKGLCSSDVLEAWSHYLDCIIGWMKEGAQQKAG